MFRTILLSRIHLVADTFLRRMENSINRDPNASRTAMLHMSRRFRSRTTCVNMGALPVPPIKTRRNLRATAITALLCVIAFASAHAQDNYEIQVYGSEMDEPGTTTLELHSNFTVEGRPTYREGVVPTQHALHETIEVAHGFTNWFETGIYLFSTVQADGGWHFVGSHLRPRVTVPESWHWPLGVSLGSEIGYQRRQFSENTWTYELQPILDRKIGRWYAAFNPTFDRALHGNDVHRGWEFSPNAKVSFDFTRRVAGGLEYYGGLGPATEFLPLTRQYHQFFPSLDLDLSPKWELNLGVGWDPNHTSDHMMVKFILGRRFSWPARHSKE